MKLFWALNTPWSWESYRKLLSLSFTCEMRMVMKRIFRLLKLYLQSLSYWEHYIIYPQQHQVKNSMISISQKRKQRHKIMKGFVQGHTSKWEAKIWPKQSDFALLFILLYLSFKWMQSWDYNYFTISHYTFPNVSMTLLRNDL